MRGGNTVRRRPSWRPSVLEPAAMMSLETPLGELFVGAGESGVVATAFDQRTFLQDLMENGHEAVAQGAPEAAMSIGRAAKDQLRSYFEGSLRTFEVSIHIQAQTPFATAVLQQVAEHIPFCETVTYAEVGERAGRLRAARAVGNILATCPFTVIVPCHRVVHGTATPDERKESAHTSRKAWLLNFERSVVTGSSPR